MSSIALLKKQAKKFEKEKNIVEAFKCYSQIITEYPLNIFAVKKAGEMALQVNNFPVAKKILKDWIKRFTKSDIDLINAYALAALNHNDGFDQLNTYKKAYALYPNDVGHSLRYADILCTSHYYNEAATIIEKLIKSTPAAKQVPGVRFIYLKAAFAGDKFAKRFEIAHAFETDGFATPETTTQLLWTYQHALRYDAMLNFMYQTLEQYDENRFDLIQWHLLLNAAILINDTDAIQIVQKHTDACCDRMIDAEDLHTQWNGRVGKAKTVHMLGNDWHSELDHQLSHWKEPDIQFQEDFLKQAWEAMAPSLHEKFEGKDLCLLMHGPSLKLVMNHLDTMGQNDNLRFATVNAFGKVVDTVMKPMNRTIDLLYLLDKSHLIDNKSHLQNLVIDNHETFLMLYAPMLPWSEYSDQLLNLIGQTILPIYSRTNSSPTPACALQITYRNTFSALLPHILLLKPRRIFIFGLDGGIPKGQPSEDFYFHGGNAGEYSEGTSKEMQNKDVSLISDVYEVEAKHSDQLVEFQNEMISRLFNVEIPKIYNVCPTSNHELFEKISMEQALNLMEE